MLVKLTILKSLAFSRYCYLTPLLNREPSSRERWRCVRKNCIARPKQHLDKWSVKPSEVRGRVLESVVVIGTYGESASCTQNGDVSNAKENVY